MLTDAGLLGSENVSQTVIPSECSTQHCHPERAQYPTLSSRASAASRGIWAGAPGNAVPTAAPQIPPLGRCAPSVGMTVRVKRMGPLHRNAGRRATTRWFRRGAARRAREQPPSSRTRNVGRFGMWVACPEARTSLRLSSRASAVPNTVIPSERSEPRDLGGGSRQRRSDNRPPDPSARSLRSLGRDDSMGEADGSLHRDEGRRTTTRWLRRGAARPARDQPPSSRTRNVGRFGMWVACPDVRTSLRLSSRASAVPTLSSRARAAPTLSSRASAASRGIWAGAPGNAVPTAAPQIPPLGRCAPSVGMTAWVQRMDSLPRDERAANDHPLAPARGRAPCARATPIESHSKRGSFRNVGGLPGSENVPQTVIPSECSTQHCHPERVQYPTLSSRASAASRGIWVGAPGNAVPTTAPQIPPLGRCAPSVGMTARVKRMGPLHRNAGRRTTTRWLRRGAARPAREQPPSSRTRNVGRFGMWVACPEARTSLRLSSRASAVLNTVIPSERSEPRDLGGGSRQRRSENRPPDPLRSVAALPRSG